ncbi:MAG TPA: hypothetical protein VLL69_09000 [Streptosporangiaceae bacterium]|nr:hypothetical protein [Streptosporangiaceae bacterium]
MAIRTSRRPACSDTGADGHRLRLSVSTTYWPWAWPSPEPVELTVLTGDCALDLPVRPAGGAPEPAPFGPPELALRPAVEILQFEPADQTVARSIAAGRFEFTHRYATQRSRLTESGIEVHTCEPDTFTICEDEPLSAAVRCERRYGLARGDDWRARLESVSEMRADAATFRVSTSLRAFDNEECLFSRTWTFDIPRDGV